MRGALIVQALPIPPINVSASLFQEMLTTNVIQVNLLLVTIYVRVILYFLQMTKEKVQYITLGFMPGMDFCYMHHKQESLLKHWIFGIMISSQTNLLADVDLSK